MGQRRNRTSIAAASLSLVFSPLCPGRADASSSADELVHQAREHEAAHEEDVAVRRYTEALSIEPTNPDAWLGLGALRMKLGDPSEAERVYAAALDRVPSLRPALVGRARARWALGRHAEAESDLEAYALPGDDIASLRELAQWYGSDGRTPAQLAIWRRLLRIASAGAGANGTATRDDALISEARRMVRALVILVDGADPASSPVDPDWARRAMARIARSVPSP
jgi:tetratricopeptide (TPR) repeat protein